MTDHRIRLIEPDDVPAVVALVHELALYERAPDECHLTEAQLHAALFGDAAQPDKTGAAQPDETDAAQPDKTVALYGHVGVVAGVVVACSLWFRNFSTWRGVHGIYLEDLYVQPEHRGGGLGRALLTELAVECRRRGYARLEWSVLNWNEPSIGFYRSLGAVGQDEWTVFRLADDALAALATRATSTPD